MGEMASTVHVRFKTGGGACAGCHPHSMVSGRRTTQAEVSRVNRLIAVAAAAIAGVVISRRKSIKDDVGRVKTAATEGAHKIDERVRGRSSDESDDSDQSNNSKESSNSDEAVDSIEEEEVLDLEQEDGEGSDADGESDADEASEEVSSPGSN